MPLGCVANIADTRYHKLADDLKVLLTSNPSYDDGNYGPVFIRLAWHSSGTYDPVTKKGGSNGATMRFEPEASFGANAGLGIPRKVLGDFRDAKHPWVSASDLWILASYVYLESSNGPVIPFVPGRVDALPAEVEKLPPDGNLPDAEQGKLGEDLKSNFAEEQTACIAHIRKIFGRMGFTDREMTCLIIGGHAYGRCHPDRSGYAGKWISNPVKWGGREYCMLLQEQNMWRIVDGKTPINSSDKVTGVCPFFDKKTKTGQKQYVDKFNKKMMLFTDMALVWDPEFKKYIDMYAADDVLLKKDFGEQYKKLTELGCPFAAGGNKEDTLATMLRKISNVCCEVCSGKPTI
ncbi:unnamed protein product [Amoebophrya sp. A120]|nr:unnamed protein product [Amoebophrya sp. A120]|eukprot:GSA120T00018671001.1